MDLSTDFYFSYIYDLSRTLQENALEISGWPSYKQVDKSETCKFFPDSKFIWNGYLLEPLRESSVSEQWFIEVVHGYVGLFSFQASFGFHECKLIFIISHS